MDPGSLAILKRLDGLEDLLRNSAQGKIVESDGIAESPIHTTIKNSPSNWPAPRHLSDTAEYRYHVNVESMLQWPVFDSQNIDQKANLKCLFNPIGKENQDLQWNPPDPDLRTEEVDQALRSFFDHVHIFNPIFEEADLTAKLEVVRANGLGWDADSCLIVSDHGFSPDFEIADIESF